MEELLKIVENEFVQEKDFQNFQLETPLLSTTKLRKVKKKEHSFLRCCYPKKRIRGQTENIYIRTKSGNSGY